MAADPLDPTLLRRQNRQQLLSDILGNARGLGQAARAIAQPMVGDIPAGLAGLGSMMLTGNMDKASAATRGVQDQFAYAPTSTEGEEYIAGLARGIEAAGEQVGRMPSAKKAGAAIGRGWDSLVNLSPATAATLAGVAAVADPTKGGGAAAKAAATRAAKVARNVGVKHREAMRAGGLTDIEQVWTPGENRVISPESLQGRVLVPIVGDNSRTGVIIRALRGAPLEGGVNVQGGPRYSQQHSEAGSPSAWAANISAARAAQNDLIKASDITGKPAVGIYTMMHPQTSQNFSVPIADITAKAIPSMRIAKSVINDFDREVRRQFPEFTSITDPGVPDLIRSPGMGDLRKKIAETAAKAKYQNAGFPLTSDILDATSEPMLKDATIGHTGMTLFESAPDVPLVMKDESVLPHETYPVGIPGKWMGGLETAGPLQQVLPKVYEAQAARGRTDPGKMLRSISMSHGNYQLADQEWVDRQMALAEILRRSQP